MLERIKHMLDSPFITFDKYFQNYVMEVQDSSIDEEVSFLFRNNFPSANSMIRLINNQIKDM